MSTAISCPACGVVFPGGPDRCPACGARSGRRRVAVLAIVGMVLAIGAVVSVVFFARGRVLGPTVEITPGVSRPAPDGRGTDVSATIENPNPMPVDVTVRIRGLDMADQVAVETTLGPYRSVPPGGTRRVWHHFATTPLSTVTFEAVEVTPTDPDGP